MITFDNFEDNDIVRSYIRDSATHDEMWNEDGTIRNYWRHFISSLEKLGGDEIQRRNLDVCRPASGKRRIL